MCGTKATDKRGRGLGVLLHFPFPVYISAPTTATTATAARLDEVSKRTLALIGVDVAPLDADVMVVLEGGLASPVVVVGMAEDALVVLLPGTELEQASAFKVWNPLY